MKKMKKRVMTIDELNAYQTAYRKPLQQKNVAMFLLQPFVVGFIFAYLLYYNIFVGSIVGAFGAIYGYVKLLPISVKRKYEMDSHRERNKFVNNMTQILANESRTVLEALQIVARRAKGEFKDDLLQLLGDLKRAEIGTQQAFEKLANRYSKDLVFCMYVDQLVTAYSQGRSSMEAIEDIMQLHNGIKEKQKKFFNRKDSYAKAVKFFNLLLFGMIVFIAFGFDFENYVAAYAYSKIGWVFSGVFLVLLFRELNSFFTLMKDDSVLEGTI